MTPQQKELIRELVQKYSEYPGTELLLAFVAETNGMLSACKTLLHLIKTGDSVSTDWLFRDCLKYNVVFHLFLEEISRLTDLLDSSQEDEDPFSTLGPAPGTDEDEIGQTYRNQSPQYHLDTASPVHRDQPEKFIEINKVYGAPSNEEDPEENDGQNIPSQQQPQNGGRSSSTGQKKKLTLWTSVILVTLITVSTGVLIAAKNKAILEGLERGRTVLVESLDTVLKSIQPEAVTERSDKQQKPVLQPPPEPLTTATNEGLADAQKLSAGEEKSQENNEILTPATAVRQDHPSGNAHPETVTGTHNSNLPDEPELPVITASPEQIDTPEDGATAIEKPLENKPAVVEPPGAVTDNSDEQQKAVLQNGFATPPPSEKPLLTLQKEQTEPIEDPRKTPLKTVSEQMPPEPVTTANDTTTLPDTQKPPAAATSPEAIRTPEAATTATEIPLENKLSTDHQTEQPQNSRSAPSATSIHSSAENIAVNKRQVQPNMQSRIDIFLKYYTKVYQQRDLVLFSRLFAADATENGKPFSSLLPTYRELFAATSDITLKVANTSWKEIEGKFAVKGRFELNLQYKDSHTFSGTGPIRLVLIYNNQNFKVSVLEYEFSAEN